MKFPFQLEVTIIKDKSDTDKYKTPVWCLNCGFRGRVEITKGHLIGQRVCPYCGCCKLKLYINSISDFPQCKEVK